VSAPYPALHRVFRSRRSDSTRTHLSRSSRSVYLASTMSPASDQVLPSLTSGSEPFGRDDPSAFCADGRRDPVHNLAEVINQGRPNGRLLSRCEGLGRWVSSSWAPPPGFDPAGVEEQLAPVLSIGVHDPTLGFTDAFFHTAAQLQRDASDAGFADVRVGECGPAWTIVDAPGDDASGVDADARFVSALCCAQLIENFAEIVDASAHLMAIATAP
jgi:hypothetical protein